MASFNIPTAMDEGVLDALVPLLNDKALRLVRETAEAARVLNDIGLAVALEMLLANHKKRASVLRRMKAVLR